MEATPPLPPALSPLPRADSDAVSLASIATANVPLGVPLDPAAPLPAPLTTSRSADFRPVLPEGMELGLRVRRPNNDPPPYELVASPVAAPAPAAAPQQQPTKRKRGGCPPLSSQAGDALYFLSNFILIIVSAAVVVLLAIGTPTTPVVSPDAAAASLASLRIYGTSPRNTSWEGDTQEQLEGAFGIENLARFRPWFDRIGGNLTRANVELSLRFNVTLRSFSQIPWGVEWGRVTARFPDAATFAGLASTPGFLLNNTGPTTLPFVVNVTRSFARLRDIPEDRVLAPIFNACGLIANGRTQYQYSNRVLTFFFNLELSVLALRMWSWTRATQPVLSANATVAWACDLDEWNRTLARVPS